MKAFVDINNFYYTKCFCRLPCGGHFVNGNNCQWILRSEWIL